ncbi:hypothetical protein CYMTET_18589 [Cymbomonas tetramitiformis]|uniref:Uncharacterized protein n=1 Tax=Cymbomonas tetramitiformis TaxID=36881 RepID=A0AAE0G8D0_9CHLO|nr:hypothetical protein CYMTET_18589 [Cymbomonas tetramitiformis]
MNRDFRRQDIFKAIDSKYCIATNDNERVDLVSQNIDDAVYLSERYFPKMLNENDEEGTAVEVEDDDKAEEDDDEAAEKDNEDAGKEEAEEGDEGEDEEEGEEDVGGDAMGPGTPQRSSKAPKRAITSFVMEHDEEIVFPSKTPKTAEENEEYEKEKQAARRK